jgi:hypothetical protein
VAIKSTGLGKDWRWMVVHTTYKDGYWSDIQSGYAWTKEKAHRAAVAAQVKMGRENFHIVEKD